MGQLITNSKIDRFKNANRFIKNDPILKSLSVNRMNQSPNLLEALTNNSKSQEISVDTSTGGDESIFDDEHSKGSNVIDNSLAMEYLKNFTISFIEVIGSVSASELEMSLPDTLLEYAITKGIPERVYNAMKGLCSSYDEDGGFKFDIDIVKSDKSQKYLLEGVKYIMKNLSTEITEQINISNPLNRMFANNQNILTKNTRQYHKPFYETFNNFTY